MRGPNRENKNWLRIPRAACMKSRLITAAASRAVNYGEKKDQAPHPPEQTLGTPRAGICFSDFEIAGRDARAADNSIIYLLCWLALAVRCPAFAWVSLSRAHMCMKGQLHHHLLEAARAETLCTHERIFLLARHRADDRTASAFSSAKAKRHEEFKGACLSFL
jgi:hypothetical protein